MTNLSPEQLAEHHRQVPADYYERGIGNNIFQRYWHNKRFKILPEILSDTKSKVLDLGCHGGLLTHKIAAYLGAAVTGLDISESAIQYAKEKYPQLEFSVADIQKGIPFPDQSFDTITAFDVLEHIPNLGYVVGEIRRVLKPKGTLVIGIPNEHLLFRTIWYFWTKSRGRVWQDVHIHKFTNQHLNQFFDSGGFERILEKKVHLRMYWVIKYRKEE